MTVMMIMMNASGNASSTSEDGDLTEVYRSAWLTVFYLIVSVVGLVGNSLVVIVLSSVSKMRTVTNSFIFHQSVIDLTSAALVMAITLSELAVPNDYAMTNAVCKLWFNRYPLWSCFMASTINLVALTVERFHAILYPLHHAAVFSQTRVCRFFPICWVAGFTFISYLVPLYGVVDGRHCWLLGLANARFQLAIGVCTVVLYYIVPLCVMVFAYGSMLREVRRQYATVAVIGQTRGDNAGDVARANAEIQRFRVQKNVFKVLALVVIVYAICWSPNQIMYLYFNLGGYVDFNGTFFHWTVIMVTCNMCINPFVYAFKYNQFREGFMYVFCRSRRRRVGDLTTHMSSPISNRVRSTVVEQ